MGRGQKRWKNLAETRTLDCLYQSPWNGLVLVRNSSHVSPQRPALIRSKELWRSCKTQDAAQFDPESYWFAFPRSGEKGITVLLGSFDGTLAVPSLQGSKAGIPVASTDAVKPSPCLETTSI